MEMIELYCELLLARAAVLDQLAFGDIGTRAKNKARDLIRLDGITGGGAGRASALGLSKSSNRSDGMKQQGQEIVAPGDKAKISSSGADDEEDSYIDPGLDEAAAAIFYSWPRFPREVRELTTLRSLLMDRWGKDFATLAQDNKASVKVPERLVKRLRVRPPSKELVESYLREIAKAYGIAWPKDEVTMPSLIDSSFDNIPACHDQDSDNDASNSNGGSGDINKPPSTPRQYYHDKAGAGRTSDEVEELSRATPPQDIGPHRGTRKSPVSVAPPRPQSDNPNPRVKIPGEENTSTSSPTTQKSRDNSDGGGAGRIPEVDELARRFAALKR
jgi:Regulator of Vps4 activity in the MVB pathway